MAKINRLELLLQVIISVILLLLILYIVYYFTKPSIQKFENENEKLPTNIEKNIFFTQFFQIRDILYESLENPEDFDAYL